MVLKKYVTTLSGNIYLNAAANLGLSFSIVDKDKSIYRLNFGTRHVLMRKNKVGVNNVVGAYISKNKDISANILHHITPIGPRYLTFQLKKSSLREIVNQIYRETARYDIVIKAPSLSLGKGVYLKPKSKRDIKRAVYELFTKHKSNRVLVEPHFTASHEYRLVVYSGKIIDVLSRKPASVVGDGTHSIADLISQKNNWRKKYGFKPIQADKKMLAHQHLTLSSIPTRDQLITLQPACNLALGGETERIPLSRLNKEYARIAKQLSHHTGLSLIGIDLMTSDISAKPTRQNAYINEFNSAPTPDVSFFADLAANTPFYGVNKILLALQKDMQRK